LWIEEYIRDFSEIGLLLAEEGQDYHDPDYDKNSQSECDKLLLKFHLTWSY